MHNKAIVEHREGYRVAERKKKQIMSMDDDKHHSHCIGQLSLWRRQKNTERSLVTYTR